MLVDLSPLLRRARGAVTSEQAVVVAAGDVDGLGRTASLPEPATVRVCLRGDARRIDVQVSARLELRCTCDRCLAAVAVPVEVGYREVWRPRLRASGDGGAPEAEEADDDAGTVCRDVVGSEVDCSDGFWQNVAFALPTKVLCRPDCRGLCPTCGAEWNLGPCSCRAEARDPRLAPLAAWRPPES
jgi:uncharacterized protein